MKAIIFDLGNVLLDFDHRRACERIFKFSDKTSQEIFDLFFDSKLTALFEEGKISPVDFFLKVKETLKLKLDYEQFVNIWNEIFFFNEKNLSVYNLAHSLKISYKLLVLTNINVLHFEYVKKTFPVLNVFQILTSFESGFIKPNIQIYELAIQILDTSPENIFYTDDRPELVKSAGNLGIRSFIFKSVEQLKKDLTVAGINIE